MVYDYDFGDGWEHEVEVKNVATVSEPVTPKYVAGARACPPRIVAGPVAMKTC